MWEGTFQGGHTTDVQVLILVCVEVSVGDNMEKINVKRFLVLILVCVEVSVGGKSNLGELHYLLMS